MRLDARNFAIQHHGDQKYGDQPYVTHLDEVAQIAQPYGDVAVVIAYLHDVVEDTTTTVQQIEEVFGAFVAECVAIVSDEEGTNRQERKVKTYAKMAKVSGEFELALLVKAADRLANLRACVRTQDHQRLQMYQNEHAVFKRSAYRLHLCEPLWQEINQIIESYSGI